MLNSGADNRSSRESRDTRCMDTLYKIQDNKQQIIVFLTRDVALEDLGLVQWKSAPPSFPSLLRIYRAGLKSRPKVV